MSGIIRLKKDISFTLEGEDGYYVTAWSEAHIFGSGDTPQEAAEYLFDLIYNFFFLHMEYRQKKQKLGPTLQKQDAVLLEHVEQVEEFEFKKRCSDEENPTIHYDLTQFTGSTIGSGIFWIDTYYNGKQKMVTL